jgi:hypothetical protein
MHLTYRDFPAHSSAVLPVSAGEAGAPDLEIYLMEDAYAAWQGRWGHALDLGGFGDLRELRDALNAAWPKA